MWGPYDISVFVLERDIFSRHCIASCLSWDRRTHVGGQASAPHEMLALFARMEKAPKMDVVLVDTGLASDPESLEILVKMVIAHMPETKVICMASAAELPMALAAAHAGARAYFVREQVGLAVASAICIALHNSFTVTHELAEFADDTGWPAQVHILPERRNHPELPQRIEQALELCVLDGLPAEVAADEMGVSTNTVRSYVKEGYRILEAADGRHFPWTMSPMERAFLRINSLEGDSAIPPKREEFVA